MWFVFGLITLISFSVYFGTKRFQARWQGTRSVSDSPAYEYQFTYRDKKSQKIKEMMVGIPAPREYDFSFKRENGLDRIFKWLGISVERQFNAADFDKLVYVVSNDRHLFDEVMDDQALLQKVVKLFKIKHLDCAISHLHCRNGRLWVVFKVGPLFNDASNISRLMGIFPIVAESLHMLAERLKADLPQSVGVRRDPFILRAMFILAISSGLAINGLTHVFRLTLLSGPFTVDTALLWRYSAYAAIVILLLMIAMTVFLLGRSARAHLVLIELLLVGSFGAFMTSFVELRDMNMELDTSPVVQFETRVIDKSISKSRKGGTRYYVHVVDWHDPADTHKFQVSSDFYSKAARGDRLAMNQRGGYLGLRWVESYHKLL